MTMTSSESSGLVVAATEETSKWIHDDDGMKSSSTSTGLPEQPAVVPLEKESKQQKKKKKKKKKKQKKGSRQSAGESKMAESQNEILSVTSGSIITTKRNKRSPSQAASASVASEVMSVGSAVTTGTSTPAEQQENFARGNGGDNRQLFLQYILSQGTPQDQAEQMADAFFAMQSQRQQKDGGASNAMTIAPSGGRSIPKAPRAFQLSSVERKAMDAAAAVGSPVGNTADQSRGTEDILFYSARNTSQIPPTMTASNQQRSAYEIAMGVSDDRGRVSPAPNKLSPTSPRSNSFARRTNNARGRNPSGAVWPRSEQPGAVEMEGRAFGAPPAPLSQQNTGSTIGGEGWDESWGTEYFDDKEDELENPGFTIEAEPVEAQPEIPMVYADSTPLGLKEFVNAHPRRRLILATIVCVIIGVVIGVVFAATGGSSSSSTTETETKAPTKAPSAMPSFIKDELLSEAEAVSGEILPGSPQFDAVGWMSTFDRVPTASIVQGGFRQRYAFVVFYLSTGGDEWAETADWLNGDKDECEWSDDIECQTDPTGRRFVTTLNLVNNKLNGTIPKEIGLMSDLTKIDLSQNMLSGSIPSELFELDDLRLLDLSRNDLSGSLPENIGTSDKIFEMRLPRNKLNDTLPDSIFRLTDMRFLDISFNQFSGNISNTGLDELVALEELHLNNNRFGGTLPTASGSYEVGVYDWNQFTGSVPGSFLGAQRVFSAAHNKLSGEFPGAQILNADEESLPMILASFADAKIQRIDVSYNDLTGSLPNLGLLPTLEELDISGNSFVGKFPAGDNIMSGRDKSWLVLSRLAIANNQFTGTLPLAFSKNIKLLDLSNNQFTGGIPEEFEVLEAVEFLKLSHNLLGGPLPDFGHVEIDDEHDHEEFSLRGLEVRNCSLESSTIPLHFEELAQLEVLDLGENSFVGTIPIESLAKVPLLNRLHYDHNQLSSTIPSTLGNLLRLTSLRLENNRFSGTIPARLQALTRLEHLSLQENNRLRGSIDEAICALPLLGGLQANHIPCGVDCDCCFNQTSASSSCTGPQ